MYPAHFGNNELFPRKKDFEVVVKDEMVGLGVISRRAFAKGEVVAALSGDIIQDIRQHSLQIEPGVHLYDIYFSGYFLHSCSPNVELDMKGLLVHAVKDIQEGDYLYMDYAQTEDVLFKQFPCSCGSDNCRGWITGRKEQVEGCLPEIMRELAEEKTAG
jgi:SET domain-containing protein